MHRLQQTDFARGPQRKNAEEDLVLFDARNYGQDLDIAQIIDTTKAAGRRRHTVRGRPPWAGV